MACIESKSKKKDVIKTSKEQLTKFVFNNGLMRFGLHVQEVNPKKAELILDWPDKGNNIPFCTEYAYAYNYGKTELGIKYKCGKLLDLNFYDAPLFSNMNNNCLLQFSDLLVGATREFIEYSLGDCKIEKFGVDLLKILSRKFRGAPTKILDRGISVSSSVEFKEKIRLGLKNIFSKLPRLSG